MEQVEVAVVGAGLLGSATARALGARGVQAVALEQFDPGHARGSSHGATRIFRLSHPDPGYVRMAAGALRAWARLQQVRYFALREPGGDWPTLIEWPPEGLVWYAVPMVGDAPGMKVAAHARGMAVDPRDGPFGEIDPALEEQAARYVRERLPGLEPAALAPETCLYTMTADEDFVLDREGQLVVGGGCSGQAFKFGPLLGEMLAGLALGQDTGIGRGRFFLSRPALATAPQV